MYHNGVRSQQGQSEYLQNAGCGYMVRIFDDHPSLDPLPTTGYRTDTRTPPRGKFFGRGQTQQESVHAISSKLLVYEGLTEERKLRARVWKNVWTFFFLLSVCVGQSLKMDLQVLVSKGGVIIRSGWNVKEHGPCGCDNCHGCEG